MGLGIETETIEDAVALVTLQGELTMAEADDLQTHLRPLLEAGRTQFVFDFSAAPFLDSGGLRVLVELYRRVQPEGGGVWIAGAAPVVRQTFEVTRLSTLLRLTSTREEALEQIRQAAPSVVSA